VFARFLGTIKGLSSVAPPPPAASLPAILREVFGYEHFRGQQQAIVDHVTLGGDALVLMPTGGGKSLCYQIPAIARQRAGRGVTLVISPLIALMHDQVGALHEAGVEAAFLNSTLDWQQTLHVERRLSRGEITLLYAAPERVTTERFIGLLDELHARGQLSLFAIDEAHCVSQWGHDFRPDYARIGEIAQRFGAPQTICNGAAACEPTLTVHSESLSALGCFSRVTISPTTILANGGAAGVTSSTSSPAIVSAWASSSVVRDGLQKLRSQDSENCMVSLLRCLGASTFP